MSSLYISALSTYSVWTPDLNLLKPQYFAKDIKKTRYLIYTSFHTEKKDNLTITHIPFLEVHWEQWTKFMEGNNKLNFRNQGN